ncbi:MAG: hypothetical protein AMJ69_11955 [Gammaproteobacteria bacterium SG8_47]|nr:MAG: hypothetical protein AMJ69_11955 [Gammaproteobacteria bacterium SG8_47]
MGNSKRSTARHSIGSRLGTLLFGFAFFAAGVGFFSVPAVPAFYDALRMSSWVSVDAQLEMADLERNRDGDSTTYRVRARYHYVFRGHRFGGERVGIHGGSDNLGSWHEDTYRRLRSGQAMSVWVNPDEPSEAIYDRSLRWGLIGLYSIFLIVFGGVGAGIMWLAIFYERDPVVVDGIPLWQSRKAWRDNRIGSAAKLTMWVVWGFAIIWNAISAPTLFIVPTEVAKGNHLALVGLLFPLVGAFIVWYAIKQTLQWRRFGATPLALDPFPGSLGGDVGGHIDLRLPMNPAHVFEIVLSCNHVYTSGSGKNRSTKRKVLWQDRQRARLEPAVRGTRLSFSFQVPADLPESDVPSSDYKEWLLEVRAALPGADYDRSFEIPVFATGAQRSRVRAPRQDTKPAEQPWPQIVRVREHGAGLDLHYPLGRNLSAAAVLVLVGSIFAAVGLLVPELVEEFDPPLAIRIVLGLLGTLALASGFYLGANSLTVTVARDGLVVTRRVFGYPFIRRIPREEIARIDQDIGMQSSDSRGTRAWYRLRAVTDSYGRVTVGDSLPSASAAQTVAARMASVLRLPAPEPLTHSGASRGPAAASEPTAAARPARRTRSVRWVVVVIGIGIFLWQAKDFLLVFLASR